MLSFITALEDAVFSVISEPVVLINSNSSATTTQELFAGTLTEYCSFG